MYAIVRIGGRQYRAEVGQSIVTEKLPNEVGDSLTFEEVLLVKDDAGIVTVGKPVVVGAAVSAKVVDQFKGKKIIVFKYKPKVRYRRKRGHRQQYTRLEVTGIQAG